MKPHKDGGDHVVGQAALQMPLEFACGGDFSIFFREYVGNERILSMFGGSGYDRRKLDARIATENDSDFIQFNSLSIDFRLSVKAPAKFDLAIRPSNAAITRAIHARTCCSCEGIRQEASLGGIWNVAIPAPDTAAAYVNLADTLIANLLTFVIQKIHAGTVNGTADRWHFR
jgi:hypothetical protein